ncbi:MAG: choice-of-anchor D domain-containing protein [Ignavibacteria bacterium]|nr:choice-of-anchor D domain-containing protein [Ignavibacteria bacterium]
MSSDIFQEPGVSTGSKVNNTGTSLNGVPGATAPAYEAAGGGTGHPFGLSGVGCNDGGGCNPPGGHGGGSGQQQTRGGGGGGYATAGQTVSAGNGGNAHGNAALVPLAGGSGGAGGNPQGFSVCSGEGGGGGGALRLSATSVTSILMSANGGDGQVRPNGPGGSGSGGAVSIETKLLFETAQLSARGGATSIPGGAGRVRLDGPRNTIVIAPSTASNFRGPSTDTSRYVPRSFVLTGTGDGNRIRLFVKSASIPWTVLGEVSSYTNNAWSFPATLPGTDDVYYLAAAQEVPNPQSGPYTAEPSWVFSQAAANVLVYKAYPRIAGSGALLFDGMLCANERTDTVFVRNDGEGPLELRGATLKPGSAFRLLQPGAFPATIAPHDSLAFVLRCTPPPLATGLFTDTLLVANSDTAAVNNPWRIALSARKDSAGLAAAEASVAFPDILLCVARQSDTTVTIVNTGTSLLQVQAPQFSDPSFSLLSPPPSAFPYNLDPVTRTLRVRIRYTPSVAGNTVAGSVTFRTGSAYCDRTVTVPLSARADSVAVRAAQTLSFRPLLCAGDVADTIWTIENTGTAPVTLAAPVSGDAHFTVPAPPFPLTLAPGEKKDVTVRYTPGAAGADAGVLSTVAQPCGVPLLLAMDGRRDSASLAAAGADFGLLSTDSLPATRDVEIRNTGSIAITVRSAAFRIGTPFSIVSGIPAIVPPGGTAMVRVRFTDPGTDGTYSDSLILNYDPGCEAAASLVRGTRGTASITLEIDTVRGAPGELVDVPVYLRSSVNPKLFGATGIRAVFRARADLLSPVSIPSGILSGNDRSIPLSLPLLPDARGVLVTLRFRAMLGMAETSPLLLDSAAGVGGALSITTVPGVFLLTNVCREGGTRLFDGSVKAFLAQNTPNPFNPSTDIEYGIAEAGEMQLAVLDMLGRRVAVLESGLRAPGRYTARFDATGLASGIYLCVLVTPTMTLQRVMTLMK